MSKDSSADEAPEKNVSDQVNRRKFVKSLGTAGGLATGITTLGTAKGQGSSETIDAEFIEKVQSNFKSSQKMRQSLKQPYRELEAARNAVEAYAEVVLKTLFEHDFLKQPVATEFDALDRDERPFDHESASLMAINGNNEWTAVLRLTKENSSHKIDLYVLPEDERSYAFVRGLNGDTEYIVDQEVNGNIVSPSDCYIDTECHDYDPNASCHIDKCFDDLGVVETFYTHTVECCPSLGHCYYVEKNCITGQCEKTHGICI